MRMMHILKDIQQIYNRKKFKMSEGCTHDCSTCSSKCSEKDLRVPCGQFSNVKKVIGVVSGKGGVGKSLVTSLLASAMQARGHATAIMDADVTGPSIPKSFGLHGNAVGDERGLLPMESKTGIKIMSVNLLLEKEDAPVVWRGPVIAGVIQQFWSEVVWGDVDYMFVDMPPGTGDVPLTVFQSLPVDGIIIVTTPQDLVTMIVKKAFNMAKLMNIPVLRTGREHELCSLPGLRQADKGVRRESHRRDRQGAWRARARQDPDGRKDREAR